MPTLVAVALCGLAVGIGVGAAFATKIEDAWEDIAWWVWFRRHDRKNLRHRR